MGRTASSSKRKSSKRKSSKLSREAWRGKKSRRNKSKKLRRHHDSDSSYSDDDSMSLASVSSSSSEDNYLSSSSDDYISRKGRSRARTDAKSRSKKSRRRSSSPERSKKRKRSKKDVNSRPRKSQKTKRKGHISSSSASSNSQSCSTCEGSSRSSEESEPERRREKSRQSKRSKRNTYKERNKTRNSRSMSPSYSSGSRRYNHHCHSVSPDMEHNVVENIPMRLRSVISVVERQYDETHVKLEKDPYKEEITYDRDDYPSPRSNDSNDGTNKRESAYISHVASDKRQGESVTGQEVTLSNHRTKDLTEDGMDFSGQHTSAASDGLKTTIPEKENETEVSGKFASSGDGDLEFILRQKALENLRRFRGGKQMNSKTTSSQEDRKDTSNDQLYAATDVHEKSVKSDASNEHHRPIDVGKSSDPMLKRDLTHDTEVERDISAGENFEKNPEMSKQNDIHQPLSWNSKKANYSTSCAVNEKSGSGISTLRQGTFRSCSAVKQATTEQAPSSSNFLATKITVCDTAATPSPPVIPNSNNNQATGRGVVNTSSSTGKEITNSCVGSTSMEHGSKEQQDESKDGSQFEQKTMSVMRGGEMVQVSYKVYIPKKAPALARRQLKR